MVSGSTWVPRDVDKTRDREHVVSARGRWGGDRYREQTGSVWIISVLVTWCQLHMFKTKLTDTEYINTGIH